MNYATLQYLNDKCLGRCFYCGFSPSDSAEYKQRLAVEHKTPKSRGGTDEDRNLVLSCRSCNSSKGTKTFEEFRAFCSMRDFEKKTGVSFTMKQVDYLRSIGVVLDIPKHEFWFEAITREASAKVDSDKIFEKILQEEESHVRLLILNGICKTSDEAWPLLADHNSYAYHLIEGYKRLHSW